MAKPGAIDTDMGLANIFKELEKLKSMCVKVGVTEDSGSKKSKKRSNGPTVAEYAAMNEFGVLRKSNKSKKGGKWFIPPRSFVRGFADGKRELIVKTMEKLNSHVASGELTAEEAIRGLGDFGEKGIKNYISRGTFTPNSPVTINGTKPNKKGIKFIKGKKSSRPLIDTGNLRNSIRYEFIHKSIGRVKNT